MKFGKEFASQMVQEWQQAYMDYNHLKRLLKDISNFQRRNAPGSVLVIPNGTLKRRLSYYRAFSGLTSRLRVSTKNNEEDEGILVSSVEEQQDSDQIMFLMSSEELGEYELVFFERLDDEFNKVLKFYKEKVTEVKNEAEEFSKQMDALIALRIKVENTLINVKGVSNRNDDVALSNSKASSPDSVVPGKQGRPRMDSIEEVEMRSEGICKDEIRAGNESKRYHQRMPENNNLNVAEGFVLPKLEVLVNIRINVRPETPVSTLKNVFISSKSDLSFSKVELKKAEENMRKAFC